MVVEKKGEYAKGEKKAGKVQPNQRESSKKKRDTFKSDNKKRNMGKTDVQERDQKRRMSPKNRIIHTKKEKLKKKDREKDEHAKTYKFVKMSNKKVKSFWKCRSVKYALQKEVIDREQEEKKDNR